MICNLFIRVPKFITKDDIWNVITRHRFAMILDIIIKPGKHENYAHIFLNDWNPSVWYDTLMWLYKKQSIQLPTSWGVWNVFQLQQKITQKSYIPSQLASTTHDEFGRDISLKPAREQPIMHTNQLPANVTDNRRERREKYNKKYPQYATPSPTYNSQMKCNAPSKHCKRSQLSEQNITLLQESFKTSSYEIAHAIAPTNDENWLDYIDKCALESANRHASLPIAPTLSCTASSLPATSMVELPIAPLSHIIEPVSTVPTPLPAYEMPIAPRLEITECNDTSCEKEPNISKSNDEDDTLSWTSENIYDQPHVHEHFDPDRPVSGPLNIVYDNLKMPVKRRIIIKKK